METIADFILWIETIRSELGQQVIAAKKLAVAFNERDIQLIRYDQIVRLEVLKSRINKEVEGVEQMESAAQIGHTKGTLLNSGLTFALGSLFMNTIGHKDSLKIGVQMAGSVLSKTVPFGRVLIGIGKGGLPEDLKIINVSRFARESNKTEPEVETSWKHNGYLLMTLQVFTQALDRVDRAILDESLSLPIKISEITKLITR